MVAQVEGRGPAKLTFGPFEYHRLRFVGIPVNLETKILSIRLDIDEAAPEILECVFCLPNRAHPVHILRILL